MTEQLYLIDWFEDTSEAEEFMNDMAAEGYRLAHISGTGAAGRKWEQHKKGGLEWDGISPGVWIVMQLRKDTR